MLVEDLLGRILVDVGFPSFRRGCMDEKRWEHLRLQGFKIPGYMTVKRVRFAMCDIDYKKVLQGEVEIEFSMCALAASTLGLVKTNVDALGFSEF